MANDLKVGDVVQVKSGGPKMTIDKIDNFTGSNMQARCVWFNGPNQLSHVFELAVLEKV